MANLNLSFVRHSSSEAIEGRTMRVYEIRLKYAPKMPSAEQASNLSSQQSDHLHAHRHTSCCSLPQNDSHDAISSPQLIACHN